MWRRGEAALIHRGRGERREADDVAGGVDVRHGGAEVRVDRDPAALVGREADRFEAQAVGVGLPPDRYRAARRRARACRSRAPPSRARARLAECSTLTTRSPRRSVAPRWRRK
jgi:hypothetical protein